MRFCSSWTTHTSRSLSLSCHWQWLPCSLRRSLPPAALWCSSAPKPLPFWFLPKTCVERDLVLLR
jgi:hypothetical protein